MGFKVKDDSQDLSSPVTISSSLEFFITTEFIGELLEQRTWLQTQITLCIRPVSQEGANMKRPAMWTKSFCGLSLFADDFVFLFLSIWNIFLWFLIKANQSLPLNLALDVVFFGWTTPENPQGPGAVWARHISSRDRSLWETDESYTPSLQKKVIMKMLFM